MMAAEKESPHIGRSIKNPCIMIIRIIALLLAVALPTLYAQAGGVRGYIRNEAGQPLEFAAIYVVETGAGGVANAQGFYELRLEPGQYTLVFQFLGYKSLTEQVAILDYYRELDVRMEPQTLQLKEVVVYEGNEDPAYTVMRRAIAKADYHRQQIDRYSARVYVKGTGRLIKAPFFVRRELAKEGIDSTTAFTSESVSLVEYERPSTFRERVISVYQHGEANSSSPMPYLNGSFYEPTIAEAISPLSPRAFAYYRFELAGYFQDRGYGVNKIRVIPRSRGDNVFEGHIYIVENLWSIHSLDLTTYKLGIKFNIRQGYDPMQKVAWMPTSARFDVTGRVLGFSFEYKYLASLSNYQITLNDDLPADLAVIDAKLDQEQTRRVEQQRREAPRTATAAEKLASGEEVSSRDLRRLMREYAEEEAEEKEQEGGPTVVENRTFTVDSTANNRDSTFWAEVRPIPLTPIEVKGYVKQDSIAKVEKAEAELEADSVKVNKKSNGKFGLWDLVAGETWKLAERRYLEYKSPFTDIQFNPVEGFNTTAELRYRRGGDHPWSLGFTPRYGFAWRRFNFKSDANFTLGPPQRRGSLQFSGGRYVSQFNNANPITEIFNTFTALINERNFLQIYEKEFGALRWTSRRGDRLKWSLAGEWANRRYVDNYTTQTWFNRLEGTYAANTPNHRDLADGLPDRERALVLSASVEAQPWLKYRIKNGNKEVIDNSSPTLRLEYRKGLPGIAESVSNFDQLDFTIQHRIRTGARGMLDLRLNAGGFINDEYVGFPDYKHFPGNRIVLVSIDPVASFRLLPYYEYSTREAYVAGHAHYQFRKFLVTRIWQVQMLGLKENVFVNNLYTTDGNNYTELGYGIDNILRVLRLEGAVAFQDGKYYDWGIRLSVASSIGGGIITID